MQHEAQFPGQIDTYDGIQRDRETELWLARGRETGRLVSVRVIQPGQGYKPDRVFNESRILKELDSEYVAKILDFGQNTSIGEYYVFLEVLEGKTIEKMVQSNRFNRLDQLEAIGLFKQILEALYDVHDKAIVHRNLRPSNIMVTPEEGIKIWDFGLARALDKGTGQVQDLLLSHAYIAPEQLEDETVDKRSDIYTAGAILFFMLTGHPPFEAGDWLSLARKIVSETPTPLRWHRNDVVDEIASIVKRCMEKQPARRFQRAADVLEWIRSQNLHKYRDMKTYMVAKISDYLNEDQLSRARDEMRSLRERYPNDHEVLHVERSIEQRWRRRRRGEIESAYAEIIKARKDRDFGLAAQAIGNLETLLQKIGGEGLEDDRYLEEWHNKLNSLKKDMAKVQGKAVLISEETGNEYPLTGDRNIVGRSTESSQVDVDLSDEPEGKTVSRHHAKILRDGIGWYIDHLSTVNPTLVGDTRIESDRAELRDGMPVQLGRVQLRFHIQRENVIDFNDRSQDRSA